MVDLALQEHGEPVVEVEFRAAGQVHLFLQGLAHAGEPQLQHALEIGLSKRHVCDPSPIARPACR